MASRPPVPPITNQFPIVTGEGRPTDYFIRWLQQRGFEIDSILTPEQVVELIQQWAAERSVIAGAGLGGGGTLDSDVTLLLNAVLNDLNDVDTVTTPPADGNVLTFDNASGLWIPKAPTGGGGGGGLQGFELLWSWDGAVNPTFTAKDLNVAGYDEFLIIMKNVTLSASQWRVLSFSSDGGATWDTTANNYWAISSTGTQAVSGDAHLYTHATSSAAARSIVTQLHNLAKAAPTMFENTRENNYGLYRPEVIVNAIRVTTVSGTAAYNGGKIWVYVRRGSGGGLTNWWFQPPLAATFTQATGGAHGWASLTDDVDEGLLFDAGVPFAGDDSIYAYQAIPVPANDWTATMRCTPTIPTANFSGFGLMCQYSVNSRLETISLASGTTGWQIKQQQLNPSSFSSETITPYNGDIKWLRIAKVGANLNFYVSSNGKVWALVGTRAVATWLTANPDRIGFYTLYNRATGPNVVGSIQYWKFV